MLEPGQEITGRGRNLPVLADGSKTGREKPPENRVNATLGKVNPKWS